MTGIYKITSPSQRVYIGQSFQIEIRWAAYRNGYSQKQAKLHASFTKYGVDNHVFEVLCVLPSNTHQVILDRHEQLYMDLYREAGYDLLNLRYAGSSGIHSSESLQKMKGKVGKWMTGRTLSAETIAKRTAKQRGLKRTEETKQRLASSKTGNKNPQFGQPAWNRGRPHSEETRKNLRLAWARRKERQAAAC